VTGGDWQLTRLGELELWLAAFSHDELHMALRFIGERIAPEEEELD
jgi:hypothetical protein